MTEVHTSMLFLEPWRSKIETPFLRNNATPGYESQNFQYERCEVTVTNARPVKESFSLDEHGFIFLQDPQSGTPELLEKLRKKDPEAAKEIYYPHVERMIKSVTGASRVIIFDHTVRRRISELAGQSPEGMEQPAFSVHVDQSPLGATRRVHQLMGEEAPELLQKRCQILNVWRPLAGPVDDWPLGYMDARTLLPSNCHPTLLWRNEYDFRGSTMFVSHEAQQKWYFLEGQRTDEVTIIKIWDNRSTVPAKCCAHCAFEDPRTDEQAPKRESIEVRCLVLYDE